MEAPPSLILAKETTQQLITLGTAVLGISATLAKEFFKRGPGWPRFLLYGAWLTMITSLTAGILTLAALTGKAAEGNLDHRSVYADGVRIASSLQMVCFVVGIGLFVLYCCCDRDEGELQKPKKRRSDN